MGSYFQMFVIVDPLDAAACDALAERVVATLIARGVFLPSTGREHEAGPAHETIVVPGGYHPRGRLRIARGDGASGRGAFGGGEGSGDGTRCPRCAYELEMSGGPDAQAWGDAIGAWWKGGDGGLACPRCRIATPITDWPAERPMGLGYLAFELWDFAALSDAFVAEMRALIGRRVLLVRGKI